MFSGTFFYPAGGFAVLWAKPDNKTVFISARRLAVKPDAD
jgi:hypothetical protein